MNIKNPMSSRAFTRTELCVVLAVIGLLASLVLPTLARTQTHDWRAVCLIRMSRLAGALAMYADANQDYLPPNPDDGNTTPGRSWCPGMAGVGGGEEFNSDLLLDPNRSLLTPYLGKDARVFKCPTDTRLGKNSAASTSGQIVASARTVSLNGAVGTNPYKVGGKAAVDGAWLDGLHGHTANKTWYCYARTSDFVRPGPSRTFTFIEEDVYSLNDGILGAMGPNAPASYKMIDWPLTYHDMAGAVTFADGHVEIHRWADNRTIAAPALTVVVQPYSADLSWLADHATARLQP